jgi:phytoene synthase
MRGAAAGSGGLDSLLSVSGEAARITRESKSNLALAFVALEPGRRRDITVFYAFCRIVDDIVDASDLDLAGKQAQLNQWRASLRSAQPNEPELATAVRALIEKYHISPEMFDEIVAGVEMDLRPVRYATFADLRLYCYRVASAVGLVSIEIFGYRHPSTTDYATNLGLALQMTNIIRDVGRDLRQDRIYLPEEDLARFAYSESDLRRQVHDERFRRLMQFQAGRAKDFFATAEGALAPEDRRSMVAAEIMGSVYRHLLWQMERDGFCVFEKEYRLSKLQKAGRIAAQLAKFYLNWPRRASV